MKAFLAFLALGLCVSCTQGASAEKAVLTASGLVGLMTTTEGQARVAVSTEEDGKIAIQGPGGLQISEAPTVIEDLRAADGPLRLQVGAVELIVGSGFTPDGIVSYSLKIDNETIELKPIVHMELK